MHIAHFLFKNIEFPESIPFDFILWGLEMARWEYGETLGARKALADRIIHPKEK